MKRIVFLFCQFILLNVSNAQYDLNSMNQAIPSAFSSGKGNFGFYMNTGLSWGMSYGLSNRTTVHAGNFLPVTLELYPVWTGISLKRQLIEREKFRLSVLGGALTSFAMDNNFTHPWNAALTATAGTAFKFISFQAGMVKYDKNPKLNNDHFYYFSIGARKPISKRWSFSGNAYYAAHYYDNPQSEGGDDQSEFLGGGMSCSLGFRRDWIHTSFYAGIVIGGYQTIDVPPVYPNLGFSFGL